MTSTLPDSAKASDSVRPRATKKRLIVCCDGTWNDSISTDSPLTNVSRISRCIPCYSDAGVVQLVSYWSGIGSGTAKFGNIVDGMTGRGISANIRDAYTFLCHNYLHDELNSDEIILIGFSRGAFTVRSIASFIHDVGLLEKAGLSYTLPLYNLWSNQLSKKRHKDDMFPGIPPSTPQIRMRRLCQSLRKIKLLRPVVKIKVCAVWDTVGSLGFPMPGPIPQRVSEKLAFINSTLPENIENAFQALALNERRKHFQPTVWKSNSKSNLRQCWFLGSHSDVGGGNVDTGLANLALVWMIAQLHEFVFFDQDALFYHTSDKRVGSIEKFTTKSREFRIGLNSVSLVKTSSSFQRAAGNIKNSLIGPFVIGGTKYRKPGQYLMNTHGLQKIWKDRPTSTNETVHWTVRVLLGLGLRECPCLQNYSTENADDGIVWTPDPCERRENAIRLQEEGFGAVERALLVKWLAAEESYSHSLLSRHLVQLESEISSPVRKRVVTDPKKRNLADILMPLLNGTEHRTVMAPFRHSQNAHQATGGTITRNTLRRAIYLP